MWSVCLNKIFFHYLLSAIFLNSNQNYAAFLFLIPPSSILYAARHFEFDQHGVHMCSLRSPSWITTNMAFIWIQTKRAFACTQYRRHFGLKPQWFSLMFTTSAILDSNQNGVRLCSLQTPSWIQTKMAFACTHFRRLFGFKPQLAFDCAYNKHHLGFKPQLAFACAHHR